MLPVGAITDPSDAQSQLPLHTWATEHRAIDLSEQIPGSLYKQGTLHVPISQGSLTEEFLTSYHETKVGHLCPVLRHPIAGP